MQVAHLYAIQRVAFLNRVRASQYRKINVHAEYLHADEGNRAGSRHIYTSVRDISVMLVGMIVLFLIGIVGKSRWIRPTGYLNTACFDSGSQTLP